MPSRRNDALTLAWALLLTLVLCHPLVLRSGYGLARDLVFVPDQPLDADALGIGTVLPRAVPVDALVSLLTAAVGGQAAFRICVLGVVLLAGWGAGRTRPEAPLTARLVMTGFAVWNPYVVERLALGQWSLLASYAAIFWLLPAARSWLEDPRAATGGVALGWIALASITPTGGVLAGLVVVSVMVVSAEPPRRDTWVRRVGAAAAVSVLQLPWVLPSLLGAATTTSDPGGVAAFASRAERPGGVLWTLLGGGGIWSPYVVPGSLGGATGQVQTVVFLAALVVGIGATRRRWPGLVLPAGVGLVVAVAASVPALRDVLTTVVADVPGGGLARDGQKWAAPYVVLVVLCAGSALERARAAWADRGRWAGAVLAFVALLLPIAPTSDASRVTARALEPVHYPADLRRAVAVLASAAPGTGDVVTLPFSSYRLYGWGNPVSASDPLQRWSARPVVVSDRLRVGETVLRGEDPRVDEVATALDRTGPVGPALARAGVGWVVVYADQPGVDQLDLAGLDPVVEGSEVRMYRVTGPVSDVDPIPRSRRVGVVGTDLAVLGVVLLGVLGSVGAAAAGRLRRRSTRRSGDYPQPPASARPH